MPKVKFLENLSLRVIVKAQIKEKILSNNTLLLQRIILGKIKIKKNLIVQRAINLMENLVRNKMGKNKIIRKKLFQKLNQIPALIWLGDVEIHIVARQERIGVGEPLIQ